MTPHRWYNVNWRMSPFSKIMPSDSSANFQALPGIRSFCWLIALHSNYSIKRIVIKESALIMKPMGTAHYAQYVH